MEIIGLMKKYLKNDNDITKSIRSLNNAKARIKELDRKGREILNKIYELNEDIESTDLIKLSPDERHLYEAFFEVINNNET